MSGPSQTDAVRMKKVAVVGAAVATLLHGAPEAYASCAPVRQSELWNLAAVIVDARALEGPTPTGVQRFRVVRYLKGRGPAVVHVATGVARNADGSGVTSSEGILVRRGERWRIFARGSSRRILWTSVCDGSWRHGGRG